MPDMLKDEGYQERKRRYLREQYWTPDLLDLVLAVIMFVVALAVTLRAFDSVAVAVGVSCAVTAVGMGVGTLVGYLWVKWFV